MTCYQWPSFQTVLSLQFNDPIASMIGQNDVKLQFYSLQKVFSVVTVEQQAATIKAQKHGLLEVSRLAPAPQQAGTSTCVQAIRCV